MSSELIDPPTPSPAPFAPPVPPAGTAASPAAAPGFLQRIRQHRFAIVLSLILLFGAAVRIYPSGTFRALHGYDETLYTLYVNQLSNLDLSYYPDIVEKYIDEQSASTKTFLPPTRFLYIFCAEVWMETFRTDTYESLHAISTLASVLTLMLCAAWSWRAGGRRMALLTTALMAASPVEIHLAQHAMIDGFFAFWALLSAWALWECLQAPDHTGWQTTLTGSLAAMVLTKENAFFAYVTLLGLLALNFKFRFGTMTKRLCLLMFLGPLLGIVTLFFLAGGVHNFVMVYQLLVARAYTLAYAIRMCDGPWYRYLLDLLITSPLVLLPAVGAAFQVRKLDKLSLYALIFIGISYVIMCNLKYGLNLRYATMWNFPERYLAAGQILLWARSAGKYRRQALPLIIAVMMAYDLRQYYIFFVEGRLYELVSYDLLRTVNIIKPPAN